MGDVSREVEAASRESADARASLTHEVSEERDARAAEGRQLLSSLMEAVSALKSQFEAWMELVSTTRAEVEELAEDVRRPRTHSGIDIDNGPCLDPALAAASAAATAAAAEARAAAQNLGAVRVEISTQILSEARVEWSRELANLRARLDDCVRRRMVEDHIAEGVVSASDQLVARVLREARREWSLEISELRTRFNQEQSPRIPPSSPHTALGLSLAAPSPEGRNGTVVKASSDNVKLQSRLAALRAIDSMEAAGRKFAQAGSNTTRASGLCSGLDDDGVMHNSQAAGH